MNKVLLLGNIGNDPELKVTQGGQAVLKFTLATSEKWKNDAGEPQEKTEWHRCVMWGKRAEGLAKHLTKGQRIFLEGQINYGSYEKEGVKHYTTDIKVFNLEFAGGKKEGGASAPAGNGGGARSSAPPPSDPGSYDGGADDEIPF